MRAQALLDITLIRKAIKSEGVGADLESIAHCYARLHERIHGDRLQVCYYMLEAIDEVRSNKEIY